MNEHEEGAHAVLAPSAAERWIQCPASIRMSMHVLEGPESIYAAEGTAAHALAELLARHKLLGLPKAKFNAELKAWRKEYALVLNEAEMMEHAESYVALLATKLAENEGSVLMLEQRLPTGVPSCWGTSDAVIVSPSIVEIVDLKYGKGVWVDAEDNPQLRLYGIGALEAFGDLLGEVDWVHMTVFQPRLGHVATEELLATELRAWRDKVIKVAEVALGPDAPFGPSEEACRWCPASGSCTAQAKFSTHRDFADPDLMDEHALAEALEAIPAIEAWCAAVRDYCLHRVYSEGQPIPGWKVVMSGGKRSIVDPEGAMEVLQLMGYELNQIAQTEPKIKGIGELEKLLGVGGFKTMLAAYVKKGDGSPSLVPEADGRPSVDPEISAQADFA